MLTDQQISALMGPLYEHFQALERNVIETICEHIKRIGELTATDIHQLNELQRVGFNMRNIQSDIASILGKSEREIYNLFSKASEIEYNGVKNIYDLTGKDFIPFTKNEQLQSLISRISASTFDTFINMSQTTGFVASGSLRVGGGFMPLAQYYQRTVDYAILQTGMGQESFYSALKSTVRAMSSNGLSYVEYASGYTRRLDSSVRMNLLGGLARMSHAQSEMIGQEVGADGYEISYHSGFRPTHNFGGEQFSDELYYRDILPLMQEPNCYHRSFPILLGISTPTYSKEKLDEMNRDEQEERIFEGKGYNAYKAQQKQRKYELAIREQKDIVAAFTAAGDANNAKIAKTKLQMINQNYKKFSNAMSLPTNPKRTGRIVA